MARKRQVLVVDDDAAILQLVSAVLRLHRVEVATAVDGVAGLALAQVMKPDVVLLDIMMPRMNGYEVCRSLKEFDDPPKVVMITALTSPEDELAALTAGADDYIRKPFTPQDILQAVGLELPPVAESATEDSA